MWSIPVIALPMGLQVNAKASENLTGMVLGKEIE